MPSRLPGEPDPAAELLGRWQSHHAGTPESSTDAATTGEPSAVAPAAATPAAVSPPRPRHAASLPLGRRRAPTSYAVDQNAAGREVVEALEAAPPRRLDPPREPVAEPAVAAPATPRRREPAPVATGRTTDVEFAPRVMARRVTGVLLLVLLPLTVAAAYLAYDQPRTLTVGVAGTLVVLTLAVYGLRVGSTPTRLAIRSGQLEVVRGSSREVFDLTSRFTRLEVVGRPGRRGWKVLMARFGRDPLVIDSSVVDPVAFTAALERHRPTGS